MVILKRVLNSNFIRIQLLNIYVYLKYFKYYYSRTSLLRTSVQRSSLYNELFPEHCNFVQFSVCFDLLITNFLIANISLLRFFSTPVTRMLMRF